MMLPHPRAYVDWKVPIDADGNEIGVCTGDVGYRYYLSWLADFSGSIGAMGYPQLGLRL